MPVKVVAAQWQQLVDSGTTMDPPEDQGRPQAHERLASVAAAPTRREPPRSCHDR